MVEFNLFLELYGTDYLLLKSKHLMVNVICQFLRYLMQLSQSLIAFLEEKTTYNELL